MTALSMSPVPTAETVGLRLLAWFAYLQSAPGLIVPRLRDELR